MPQRFSVSRAGDGCRSEFDNMPAAPFCSTRSRLLLFVHAATWDSTIFKVSRLKRHVTCVVIARQVVLRGSFAESGRPLNDVCDKFSDFDGSMQDVVGSSSGKGRLLDDVRYTFSEFQPTMGDVLDEYWESWRPSRDFCDPFSEHGRSLDDVCYKFSETEDSLNVFDTLYEFRRLLHGACDTSSEYG